MRSRQGITGVPGKCLDADVNISVRQNEKDKKTFCSACMSYGFAWTFCMDEEVYLLLWMEGSLLCFQQWQWVLTFRLRSRDNAEIACDNVTILEAWNVASSQLMEFVDEYWLVAEERYRNCIIIINCSPTFGKGKVRKFYSLKDVQDARLPFKCAYFSVSQ